MTVSTIQLFALCSLFVQALALGGTTEIVEEGQEKHLKPKPNIFERNGLKSERRDMCLYSKDLEGNICQYSFFGSVELGSETGWHNITISREQCCEGKSALESQTWVDAVKPLLDNAGIPDENDKLIVSMVVSSSVRQELLLHVINRVTELANEPLWNGKEDLYTMRALFRWEKDAIKAHKELADLKLPSQKSEQEIVTGNSENSKTTKRSQEPKEKSDMPSMTKKDKTPKPITTSKKTTESESSTMSTKSKTLETACESESATITREGKKPKDGKIIESLKGLFPPRQKSKHTIKSENSNEYESDSISTPLLNAHSGICE